MQSPSGPGANYGDAHDDEETSRVNNPLPLPSELVQGHRYAKLTLLPKHDLTTVLRHLLFMLTLTPI